MLRDGLVYLYSILRALQRVSHLAFYSSVQSNWVEFIMCVWYGCVILMCVWYGCVFSNGCVFFQGRAMLHWSCDRGHKDLVSVLLLNKADINSQVSQPLPGVELLDVHQI